MTWRLRLNRPPLPLTGGLTLLLIVLPALALLRWPRPRAQGLEQLMAASSLLQSFSVTPDRAPPELWRQRLGLPLALRVWRQQRRIWWQFWGVHAEVPPYLALPAAALPGQGRFALPANALKVGNLVVLAPDPLARQLLRDRLRPLQRRSRGLERRCLQRLETDQAAFWNPTALGVILGPLSPLLQRYHEGCFSLSLQGAELSWSGEASAIDGLLAAAPQPAQPLPAALREPLPRDLLLELHGGSLDLLLQGLVSRELIRDPLASRYGLDGPRLARLRRLPFRLRLHPLAKGPFQASLELQLPIEGSPRFWDPVFQKLIAELRQQQLTPLAPAGVAEASLIRVGSSWKRSDGTVVGGWRWLAGSDPQLLLFLGPLPPGPSPLARASLPAPGSLWLRSQPLLLASAGLIPAEMPEVVRRSSQLWLAADAAAGSRASAPQPLSRLLGWLRLAR